MSGLSEQTKRQIIGGVKAIICREGAGYLMNNLSEFVDSLLEEYPSDNPKILPMQKEMKENRREVERMIAGLLGMM